MPRTSIFFAIASLGMVLAAPPAGDTAEIASSMNKFKEMYDLATQLMNFGGNILNNAGGSGGSSSSKYNSESSGNGILGEVVRPQLRGVSGYDASSSMTRPSFGGLGGGGGGGLSSEYGGGTLGVGSRSQPRSILDTLMGSFLGSSLSSSSPSSTSSIFQPTYEEYGESRSKYGGASQGGSNIEAIVDALSRTGAKRATPEPDSGLNAGSLLSQFFGGGR